MASLSLVQLLDLALRTPDFGTVQYRALYHLMLTLLQYLGMQDLPALQWGQSLPPLMAGLLPAQAPPALEEKWDRAQGAGQQPQEPGKDLTQGTASGPQVPSVAAVGRQRKETEALEDDVSQDKALSQGLLQEVTGTKADVAHIREEMQAMMEALGLGKPQDAEGLTGLRDQVAQDSEEEESVGQSPSTRTPTPGEPSGTSSSQASTSGLQLAHPGTHGEEAEVQPSSPLMESSLPGSENTTCSALGTQVALSQAEQLDHIYTALEEQVAQLEATRVDQAELEKLHLLSAEGDSESIPNLLSDLQTRVSSLQGQETCLQEKIRQLEQSGARMAKQLQEQLDKLQALEESVGQEQAACSVCRAGTSRQLGQLMQQHEELQELVKSLMSQQAEGKVSRQLAGRSQQDEELLKTMQARVVELQRNCEELSSVTGSFRDEHQQRQQDLEVLSQALERLQKEKADKEELLLVMMDMKADRAALAGTVSRSQFEASTEQLEEWKQEVLRQMTDLEQGCLQFQRQQVEQMDSKLDRLELGLFQQQLEKQWKRRLQQVKEHVLPTEADEAAGLKQQLLVDVNCLSCDRPVSVAVPGPRKETLPFLPPLSPCHAEHPQTDLGKESTQQHREQVAECRYPRVPRACGGQHTVTHVLQYPLRLQPRPPSAPKPPRAAKPPQPSRKQGELELLGQDDHTGRGRRNGAQQPWLPC